MNYQTDRLEAQRFDLKLKKLQTSDNDALVELYQERIDEITQSIETYDGQLKGSNSGLNRLDFSRFRRDEQLDAVCNRKQTREGSGNGAAKFDIGDEVYVMDTDLNNPTNLNTKFQGRIRSVSHDGTRYIYTLACEHPSDYYHQEDVTLVKCKDIIQDIKSRMREMIRRYEASGNGSDMATFDEDGED